MATPKKAYPAICPRCEGTGSHQGGRCFQCGGARIIRRKTSKIMRTFSHPINFIDGRRKYLVTWGRDSAEAFRCAEIWLEKAGIRWGEE